MNEKDKQKRIAELTEEERHVTQEKGTEPPFSGKFLNHNEDGIYTCKVCNAPLFSSKNKLTSSSMPGWPSFDDIVEGDNVLTKQDLSYGMVRTELLCKQCGAHLGHVFDDGPTETTGKHYCVNSISLNFEKNENS